MPVIEYAFKCRNCGTLEPPEVAGELEHPAACHICGHGVRFDQFTGLRSLEPDNWIVLADLEGADLEAFNEFHRLDPDLHAIVPPKDPLVAVPLDRAPVALNIVVNETVTGEDLLQ